MSFMSAVPGLGCLNSMEICGTNSMLRGLAGNRAQADYASWASMAMMN
jgi:hypothetical protein